MKIKAKQIDTTGGLTLQGETINRLTHTDADGKLKAANLLKIDTANARLGIGTTTPTATLDITGDTAGEAQVMIRQHNDDADGPDLVFTRSRGYEASKSALQSGDNVGRVNAEAWTGSAYTQNGTYGWTATDTAGNSEFSLKTRVSGTFADRFAIDSAGKVKISDAYTLPDSDGTNGQVLTTNGSGALSFADAAGGGASSLNELSDATITSPSDGQVLSYDSASAKWINANASGGGGGGVPDVTVSSPSTTQTLSAPSASEEVYIYTPSAAITVNLVAAATCGAGFRYHIKNRGSFTLTIDANSTETIDGSQTYALSIAESAVTLVTDGSNWFII